MWRAWTQGRCFALAMFALALLPGKRGVSQLSDPSISFWQSQALAFWPLGWACPFWKEATPSFHGCLCQVRGGEAEPTHLLPHPSAGTLGCFLVGAGSFGLSPRSYAKRVWEVGGSFQGSGKNVEWRVLVSMKAKYTWTQPHIHSLSYLSFWIGTMKVPSHPGP